jgi:hypothetical protein
MHPKLRDFFNFRYDELLAALLKASPASSATKGRAREGAIGQVLDQVLPPLIRRVSGDVLDAAGRSSGQLDGILVHQSFPTLDLADGAVLVPAEGVVAVVESKSDLAKQWNEVVGTWEKLKAIRRAPPSVIFGSGVDPSAVAAPFVVVGLRGWATAARTEEAVQDLQQRFGPDSPPIFVLNVEQRAYAVGDRSGLRGHELRDDQRGNMLAQVWAFLSETARSVAHRPIPWHEYLVRRA